MLGKQLKRAFSRIVKPTCPQCDAPIAPDDIDLRKGVMLCRGCGRLAYVEDAAGFRAGEEPPWSPDSEPVPAPPRPSTRVEEFGGELTLWRRTGSIAVGLFLLLWFCGWTAGCAFLLHEVVTRREAFLLLFAVPFLAAWVFVALLLPWQFFGFERLRIGPDGLHHEWGALIVLGRRHCGLDAVRRVCRFATAADSETNERRHGLRIETTGAPIRFGKGAGDKELRWLADLIQRHIHRLAPGAPCESATSASKALSAFAASEAAVEVLQPTTARAERPADAALRLDREFNRTVFTRRTPVRAVLAAIGGVTLICLFWNGIVGVFVVQLFREFQWFLAVFLVPFVAVGLLIVGVWLAALLTPFTSTQWVFRPGEIATCRRVLGLGREKSYPLGRLARLELRREAGRKNRFRSTDADETADRPYALALVNEDGSDLITFDGLTEGEARWIAAELYQDFRQWYVKVGS